MSLLTAGAPAVTDLAGALVADLQAGRAPRQTVGSKNAAFSWTVGLPQILASRTNNALSDGLSFNAVRVKPSGTPVVKTAEGATKPTALALENETVPLAKYPGLVEFSTEMAITTEALVPALIASFTSQILKAFDSDCAAVLDADNGLSVSAATWQAAILQGTAEVAREGGAPNVLVVGASDYAAAAASPSAAFVMSGADAVVTLYGLQVVIMPALPAGTGYVLDANAVMAWEHTSSPAVVVDIYSGLSTNKIRVVTEAFLGFAVVSPAGVCQLTVGGAAGTSAQSAKRK